MRYIVKWNNGFWKIFDTENYCDCEMFGTFKEAQATYNS